MKRARYVEGPLTSVALREWMEFEERRRGLVGPTPTERAQKLAVALAEAERSVDPKVNAIVAPEVAKRANVKRSGRRPKLSAEPEQMHRARRNSKRN